MSSETVEDGLALKEKTCTGCYACYNICPVDAIIMDLNGDGFCVSSVDKSKCIKCGKCAKVCPQINPVFDNDPAPKCYAVKAEDSIREASSSGGMFYLLSDTVLSQGGYVCGPVYDSNMNVVFKMTNDRTELKKMQGSKYVFSDMGGIHKEIKKKLDEKKLVMFTGCPCQVAGVRNFIGKNDNLITVDLLCGGLPAKRTFQQYIAETSKEKKIVDMQFRPKDHPFGTAIVKFEDGSEEIRQHDVYFLGFLTDLIKSDSCASCTFANTPRQGDISLGDLWKANKIITDTDISRGISCVMLNSNTGKVLFDKSIGNAAYCAEIPVTFLKRNNRLQSKRIPHPARQRFFSMLNRGNPFIKSVLYSLKWKYDVGITGFWRTHNFGGVLTYYALYNVVLDLGLEPLFIEARSNQEGAPAPPKLLKTRYPPYYVSRYRKNLEAQKELNQNASKFIVGSDQVWNRNLIPQSIIECYTLDFVDPPNKKISIASSFGSVRLVGGTAVEQERFVNLLKKFDHVSVRENDGVELCKSYGIEATRILDPVMLCDEKHYRDLIESSPALFPKDYAFYYVGNILSTKLEVIAKEMDYGIIKISRKLNAYDVVPSTPITDIGTVENWVKCIYNSSFVVSDSFHATVFAILFKKPFVLLYGNMTTETGLDRFTTLLEMFGLEDRLFRTVEDICLEDIMKPIDYDKVHSILEKERKKSMDWVKKALLDDQ
jgi:Coenzyme F420-reducing hydrogenase, beta subunit